MRDHLLDATTAKAIACPRKGLELVESLGCSPVIVESDSLDEACNGTIEVWSPYTTISADCSQMAQRIGNISFQHCPREANMVVHKLARYAFNTKHDLFWYSNPPNFIIPFCNERHCYSET